MVFEKKDRRIYLIRHGEPQIPDNQVRCISDTDLLLTDAGKEDASQTADWLKNQSLSGAIIISSPLTRCRTTAEIIAKVSGLPDDDVQVDGRIREISCGHWEGMTFEDIKKKYPDEFRERGDNISSYVIPGGENYIQAGERFAEALDEFRQQYKGDIIIVAHAGIIRGYLLKFNLVNPDNLFDIPMPYAGITILRECDEVENDKDSVPVSAVNGLVPEFVGIKPYAVLNEKEINRIYSRNNVPEHIIRHMVALADYQDILLDKLEKQGISFDRELLRNAALLHDIKRLSSNHPKAEATFMRGWGFPDVAALIENHHSDSSPDDLSVGRIALCDYSNCSLCAADILFYADKRVREDRIVSIEERFAASRGKCTTPEALDRHTAIYNRAVRIESELCRLFT